MLEYFPYVFDADSTPMGTAAEVEAAFRAATPGVEAWASTFQPGIEEAIMEHWGEAWGWLDDDHYGTCSELQELLYELIYMDCAEKDNIKAFARKVYEQTDCWLYDYTDEEWASIEASARGE